MRIKSLFIGVFLVLLSFFNCFAQEGNTIKDYLEQVLPDEAGRRIVLDEVSGLLTITDTPSNHKLIRKLLKQWDVGRRQISIEAKFVEITEGALLELGVEWMGTRSDTGPGGDTERRKKDGNIYIGPAIPSDGSAGTVIDDWKLNPAMFGDGDGGWAEGFVPYDHNYPWWSGTEFGAPSEIAGLGLWIGKTRLSGSELFMYLRALEETNKASLLSAPRVTTLSGQMANIELAVTIPYATTVEVTDTASHWGGTEGFGKYETYEIDERKTGIFLEVTPVVGEDSRIITLDLHPEVSEIVKQVSITDSPQFPAYLGWPVVDTRSTWTAVSIRSGQTIILGGLMRDEEKIIERKVPLLGDIPLLGKLFRYKYANKEKKNLVIFLTATLISPEGQEIK